MSDCVTKVSHTDETATSALDRSVSSQTGVEYSQWTELRTPSSQVPSCHNGKLNLLESAVGSMARQLTRQAIEKYQKRGSSAGGRSYGSPRCQRLVEDSDSIYKAENGTQNVAFPTDCGKEVSLKSSKDCTTAGYCTWNLCDEHICHSCREQGEVTDFEYHMINAEEGMGEGESAGA
ncbi:hypothetical protein V865_002524 [Kwoniella europaea PYCC6329]|uniref:Uncharacterized protein n=1 Tax=Kwoniella europaea PYCC6329 TaxID=1423913 RepID=A0AAX4KFW5_9TREE